MKTAEVKEIAKQLGIKVGQMRKTDIIRAIQKAEGNEECFASGKDDVCGQTDCLWREDCH